MPGYDRGAPGARRHVPWARRDWTRLADLLLSSARRFASPGHARITLPGPEGGYGGAVDGLEGFARTFLLAGFRIAGERCAGLDELAEWYATGVATGTDPGSPERWVRLDEHPQAKVEAASLALTLDLTRPWIWDRLGPEVRERVIDYLSPVVGDTTYPQINWVWFRLVVQTFLRSVGGPWSADEIAADLAAHETFRRADGWLSDGQERAYDHYAGWALHLYPTLWAGMSGAADLAAGRRARDVAALDRFLQDAVALVGSDGSPLIQGRSLIYRFAAAAPFWAGVLADVPSVPPGRLRHAAERVVRHFVEHGAPDERGLLTPGWHAAWPRLAQSYSGPGSPYWASKGLLGISLPEDHPVWTAPAQPLPVETTDVLRAVQAPGWLISGTRADGVVRVVNHGTDHAAEGSDVADSPLYARLGYSTATAPLLDEAGWTGPADQSVAVLDDQGRATHRSGMSILTLRVDHGDEDPVGVAGSTALAHWVQIAPDQPDHGAGRAGRSRPAGRITVWSLVRSAWELRLVRLDELAGDLNPVALRLRVAGWPIAGGTPSEVSTVRATVVGARLTSCLRAVPIEGAMQESAVYDTAVYDTAVDDTAVKLRAADERTTGEGAGVADVAGVAVHPNAGPLGGPVLVPWLEYPVRPGAWVATLVELSGSGSHAVYGSCHVVLEPLGTRVAWPDGRSTITHIPVRSRALVSKESG